MGALVPLPHAVRNRATPRVADSAATDVAPIGSREQQWLDSHWREYVGRWVAISGNHLVAEGVGARETLEKAQAAGVLSPFLIHVTKPSEMPFGGW